MARTIGRSERCILAVLAAVVLVEPGGFSGHERSLPDLARRAPLAGVAEAASPGSTPDERTNIVTMAGAEVDIGDNGPATEASLLGNLGIAIHAGSLYISELFGNRVRKVDLATGIITTFAGTGAGDFGGDGGPANAAALNTPFELLVHDGSLYIADASNNRIRKVDLASGIITTVAGTGAAGFNGDGIPATTAQLNTPRSIGVDGVTDELYISEFNGHRVRRVDLATGMITTVAGTGVAGFNGDDIPATTAQINAPRGIAVDARTNDLYITEHNGHRVRKVVRATGIITTVTGTGLPGFNGDGIQATAAQVNTPNGVRVDDEAFYIAEVNGHRVRKVDLATGTITTVAGTGVPGFSGDGGPASLARMNGPVFTLADDVGQAYVSEFFGNVVRKIDPANVITTVARNLPRDVGDGGPATDARILVPHGLALDSTAASLFLSDAVNNRIRKVDLVTGIITTIAGTGAAAFGGDGGPAAAARINGPRGIALDAASRNLYIADRANQRIRKVDLTTGIITTVAGTGVAGFNGDGIPATTARISSVHDLVVHGGQLYLADTDNERIRMVDLITGIITTVAGTGIGGFDGDGIPATAAQVNRPFGVAVDSNTLYIADRANHRIRRVDLVSGIISTVAGTGTSGYNGDDIQATAAQLNEPQGVVGGAGSLHVADFGNNRIRRIDLATGMITTVAGTGDAAFGGDGGRGTAARISGPRVGLAVDPSGNVYFSDSSNDRVRRLNVAVAVDVGPPTLGVTRSRGRWITAAVTFLAGRDPRDVDLDSIRLQAIDPSNGALRSRQGQVLQIAADPGAPLELVDTDGNGQVDQLVLKFDRATVASWADGAPELVLRLEGQFQPPIGATTGRYFSGDTQIRVP
jgi:sugar lactone lactonase YvrE